MLALTVLSCGRSGGQTASSSADFSKAELSAPAPKAQSEMRKSSADAAGGGFAGAAESASRSSTPGSPEPAAAPPSATSSAASSAAPSVKERKLVLSATLRLRVGDLEKAEEAVMAALKAQGGYAAYSQSSESSRSYTLRVPSGAYGTLLSTLGAIGKVLYRTESAEDVTLRFYDMEGRLSTKRALLSTFRGYLAKARNIEEMMTVESRIADLQNEVEWIATELASLADLTDYATVELELLPPASTVDYGEPTLLERIGELFRSLGSYLSTLAVILVGMVVFGIPALALLALLYWLLLGKIGLLRTLWRAVAPKKPRA
jgi:hypothetical protein